MLAYHNDPAIKAKFVQRMKDHIAADELVRGVGFEHGRGCAIGCTLNRYDHSAFPDELGVPVWAAYLIDMLHEHTSADVWPTLSLRFLEAVQPGANLEPVRNHINLFMLRRNRERAEALEIDAGTKAKVIAAIDQVSALHLDELRGVIMKSAAESAAWSAARSAAESAARSAEMDAIAEEFIRLVEAAVPEAA